MPTIIPASAKAPGPRRPVYIFNPVERELDEAIFRAFNGGPTEVQAMLEVIDKGADVNFQRKNADDTTPLMAAAFAGSVSGVSRLLRRGANHRMRDQSGLTALDLAMQRGFKACEILLRQAASEDSDEEDEGDADAYVFDVYMLGENEGGGVNHMADISGGGGDGVAPPVVRVDGLGYVEGEEMQLVFEDDSDWSEGDGDDDEDSNSEGYYANDYPEDPASEEGSDEEEVRRMGMAEGFDEEFEYDDGHVGDLGIRMEEASRRHVMEDLRGGGRGGWRGGGGPFYSGMGFRPSGGVSSDDDDDHGYGPHMYGGSDEEGVRGRFDQSRYRTTAYDPEYDDDSD